MTALAWDQWIYGVVAGFIGGGASAIVSGPVAAMIAPNEINLSAGAGKLFLVMLINFTFNGLVGMFLYLKQQPLPAIQTVTTTTTATTAIIATPAPAAPAQLPAPAPATVTTTVSETTRKSAVQ